jgi:hypothetical protein
VEAVVGQDETWREAGGGRLAVAVVDSGTFGTSAAGGGDHEDAVLATATLDLSRVWPVTGSRAGSRAGASAGAGAVAGPGPGGDESVADKLARLEAAEAESERDDGPKTKVAAWVRAKLGETKFLFLPLTAGPGAEPKQGGSDDGGELQLEIMIRKIPAPKEKAKGGAPRERSAAPRKKKKKKKKRKKKSGGASKKE